MGGRSTSRHGPWSAVVTLLVALLLTLVPPVTFPASAQASSPSAVETSAGPDEPDPGSPPPAPGPTGEDPSDPDPDPTGTGTPATGSGGVDTLPPASASPDPHVTGPTAGAGPSTGSEGPSGPAGPPTPAASGTGPRAPSGSTDAEPPDTETRPVPDPSDVPAPPAPDTTAGIRSLHARVATFGTPGSPAHYLPADTGLTDAQPGTKVRVGFQLNNASGPSATVRPLLQFRADGAEFAAVPADFLLGAPMRMSAEWVTVPGGTAHGPGEATIPTDALGLPAPAGRAVAGHRTMAANPAPAITLAAGQHTEIEFTVAISVDAAYATTYTLRLVDDLDGAPIPGARITVTTGGEPEQSLSPGQRSGLDMPPTGTRAGPRGGSAVRTYALQQPGREVVAAATASSVPEPVHGPYALATSSCAACHRTHTATGTSQVTTSGSHSTLCFLCHDGTGSRPQRQGAVRRHHPQRPEHAGLLPARRDHPDDRRRRPHDRHRRRVRRREQPALASAPTATTRTAPPRTRPPRAPRGGRVSGRMQAGTRGEGHQLATPGTAPRYTFLDTRQAASAAGVPDAASSATRASRPCRVERRLPAEPADPGQGRGAQPGQRFVPPGPSPGDQHHARRWPTNLAGTSPYKKWDFTTSSTIRCTHCHAGPQAISGTVTAGADLPAHTSANRGLLLAPYRNRVLKRAGEAYSRGGLRAVLPVPRRGAVPAHQQHGHRLPQALPAT